MKVVLSSLVDQSIRGYYITLTDYIQLYIPGNYKPINRETQSHISESRRLYLGFIKTIYTEFYNLTLCAPCIILQYVYKPTSCKQISVVKLYFLIRCSTCFGLTCRASNEKMKFNHRNFLASCWFI